MNLLLKLSTLFILLILSGCITKQDINIDTQYTQSELDERQRLNKTYAHLKQISTIDSALYLNTADLSKIIEKTFKDFTKHFTELDAPGFSKTKFGHIYVHLQRGVIKSKVNFSFEVDALKRVVYGHFIANHLVKAGNNEFIIHTNFKDIVLDKIDNTETLEDTPYNKELITLSVKSFLHTLNIEIINMPLKLEVDLNILHGINGKDIFSSNDYKLHAASAINMQTKMQTYLAHVNHKGLLLLGSSELNKTKKHNEEKNLITIKQNFHKLLNKILMKSMGTNVKNLQNYSSYYISRDYLAKQMSKALVTMDLRVINKFFLNIPKDKQNFQKDIFFFDKDKLPSCLGVSTNCSELIQSCDRQCDIKFGVHGCIQCEDLKNPFEKVRCVSKLEACKANEDLNLYACNKAEDSCEVKNIETKTQCAVENLTRVSMCKEDKEKLMFIKDELLLTQLRIDFDIPSSYIVQRIKNIKFSKNLESLQLVKDIHISVNSDLNIDLNKSNKNDFSCELGLNNTLHTHSQIDLVNQIQDIRLSTQRLKNGSIEIKAISEPSLLNIQMKANAYDTLIKDKLFTLQCSYKMMPMQLIEPQMLLEKKEIPLEIQSLLGNLEIDFKEEELSFIILPIKLNNKTSLYPTMQSKAMVFSRKN